MSVSICPFSSAIKNSFCDECVISPIENRWKEMSRTCKWQLQVTVFQCVNDVHAGCRCHWSWFLVSVTFLFADFNWKFIKSICWPIFQLWTCSPIKCTIPHSWSSQISNYFVARQSKQRRKKTSREMEVQKLTYKILCSISMCLESDASRLKLITVLALNVVVAIFLIAFGIMTSIAYMYSHANDLQNCLFAAYQVVAFTIFRVRAFTSHLPCKKMAVHNVFVDFSRIAMNRKGFIGNELRYDRTKRKCYYGALLPPLIICIVFLVNSIAAASHSVISGFLSGHVEPSKWYTPYTMKWV